MSAARRNFWLSCSLDCAGSISASPIPSNVPERRFYPTNGTHHITEQFVDVAQVLAD